MDIVGERYYLVHNKINDLLLNGHKIIRVSCGEDVLDGYRIEYITIEQKTSTKYVMLFKNKVVNFPYPEVIFRLLENSYQNSIDEKKKKADTKLLEDFNLYIDDIKEFAEDETENAITEDDNIQICLKNTSI